MKNLLIYISPSKDFTNLAAKLWKNETAILAKVQIDNSLALGWKPEDIMIVTNFPYEYNGIKSLVVDDNNFCDIKPTASKINVILTLFKMDLIKDDELYWFHDWDAFQNEWITEEELMLDGYDLCVSEYGITTYNELHNGRLSTGSIFFKKSALDIFERISLRTYERICNEEISLLLMVRTNERRVNQRMKRMDIRYNFATRKRDFDKSYEVATKPLKVVHFHPFDTRPTNGSNDNMAVCVYGKNKLGKPILSDTLLELFKKHEIQ